MAAPGHGPNQAQMGPFACGATFEGIAGATLGLPKFKRSLAKVKALNSDALPTDHERTHLWPNTLFVDDEYLKSGASGYGKVWRVHSVVIDNKHKGNEKYIHGLPAYVL